MYQHAWEYGVLQYSSIGGRDGPASSRPSNDMADYELPSYDDIVDDEPVMDENERIARQEEEDARIAKELFEKEQKASQAEVSQLISLIPLRLCHQKQTFVASIN